MDVHSQYSWERGWSLNWKFHCRLCRRNFKRHGEPLVLQKLLPNLTKLALNAALFPFTSGEAPLSHVNNFSFLETIDFVKRPHQILFGYYTSSSSSKNGFESKVAVAILLLWNHFSIALLELSFQIKHQKLRKKTRIKDDSKVALRKKTQCRGVK